MSRLMSVALTEQAVRDRTKTVTRRLGWEWLKAGDRLTLCRKVMGRKRADGSVEPLVRIAEVEVTSVRRELLNAIDAVDVHREGFTGVELVRLGVTGPAADFFVEFFCKHMKCKPEAVVTRIQWRYLDEVQS